MTLPIDERYAWALERLRAALPDAEVIGKLFDYGNMYVIRVDRNGR